MNKPVVFKKILITGSPGIGKTTSLIMLLEKVQPLNPVGFYTREIRKNNIRVGFELLDLEGHKSILSHVNINSTYKIGKYGVDIIAFEKIMESIDFRNHDNRLILIDEIGKMECLSKIFRETIEYLLDSNKNLIATIARRGEGFINKIRNHPDIQLFELTKSNRDRIPTRILEQIGL